jgi:hypothetical protein
MACHVWTLVEPEAKVEITGRQKEVLSKLLDMYRKQQEPLHYNLLAEQLGVSGVTAYEMLRLLESRGFLQSEYVLPSAGRGAGRSMVVFRPTTAAYDLLAELAGDEWADREWEEVKDFILEGLRDNKSADYEALLKEILARLPDRKTPLLFATDMVAASILGAIQAVGEAGRSQLLEHLFAAGSPGRAGLGGLPGLMMGINLIHRASRQISYLISLTKNYQEALMRLSEVRQDELAAFAREMLQTMGS